MIQKDDLTIEPIKVPESASLQAETGLKVEASNGRWFRLTISKGVILTVVASLVAILSR